MLINYNCYFLDVSFVFIIIRSFDVEMAALKKYGNSVVEEGVNLSSHPCSAW